MDFILNLLTAVVLVALFTGVILQLLGIDIAESKYILSIKSWIETVLKIGK